MIREKLIEGLKEGNWQLADASVDKLLRFVGLLEKWNKVHNLTSICSPTEMVTLHLLDSLMVLPYIKDHQEILDVGTGAGIPGLVLAIAKPEAKFTLLDSSKKKISFVQHAITTLKLENATAVSERVENFQPDQQFDLIISRAFSKISDFVIKSKDLSVQNGVWIAMKGNYQNIIAEQLPEDFQINQIQPVQVPGLDAERHLVVMSLLQ